MNKFKLMLALLAAPAMVLTSCGGDDTQQTEGSISKVTVSCASSVMVGKSVTATANVSASGGAKKTVTWSTSDSTVATVSSSGKITGKKVGKATITATSTVDKSKSASVEIQVIAAEWSENDKELMEYYLGEVLPYVDGDFAWTDEYLDYYGCLTAEASGDHAKSAYNTLKAAPGFTDEGSYDDEGTTVYYLSKDCVSSSDYYLAFEIYYYDKITSIDVYMQYVEYDAWPSERIASAMTECGFEGVVPSYDAGDDAGYTASVEELEDGSQCVYITVTDYDEESVLGAADYVDSLNADNYIIIEDGYDYLVSPKDKAFTMYVYDLESYYYYGFEIIVMDYIPDDTITINEGFDMIEVGGNLQLTLTKGIDVTDSTIITYESSNTSIATVSSNGLVTGVSKGEVTISAKVDGEVVSSALFYVVDSIKTEWSVEDKAEFANIHEGLGDKIPFDKYFDSVEYDAEDAGVYMESSMYSYELDVYREALVADGWTDILVEEFGELADLAYILGGYPYMFEKDIEIEGQHYFVGMELWSGYTEDEDFVLDFEGYLTAVVYDDYFYDYAEAVNEIKAYFADFEVETTASFPDSIPGSHYSVSYDNEYGSVDFYAYDVGSYSIDTLVSELNAKNWEVTKEHEDASVDEEGNPVPAYDYIVGSSKDEILGIEGYVEDGVVILYIYLPSTYPTLVTDIDDLQEGDFVSFGCIDKDVALGALSGKYFTAVDAEFDETYSLICDEALVFEVGVDGDYFTFTEVESGGLLGTTANKNVNISGNGAYTWDVSISADGDATVASTTAGYGSLQYNAQDPRFVTYTSAQTPIQIFVW